MNRLLLNSIESKQKLELIYLTNDNQISQRIIRVLKMREDSVLAYCYTRRKVRTFKLDNMLSIGLVRKRLGA